MLWWLKSLVTRLFAPPKNKRKPNCSILLIFSGGNPPVTDGHYIIIAYPDYYIDLTWVLWCLKSLVTRLFAPPKNKRKPNCSILLTFSGGNPPVTDGLPSLRQLMQKLFLYHYIIIAYPVSVFYQINSIGQCANFRCIISVHLAQPIRYLL